jgi:hypothetical protein
VLVETKLIGKFSSRYNGSCECEGFQLPILIFGFAVALLMGLAVSAASAGGLSGDKKELSHEQAGTVVLTFLKSQGYRIHSPKFNLESDPADPEVPDFYMFHAYYDTPTRLNSIGAYAVNRKTAILWERVACEQLNARELEQLQNRLRKELGLSVAAPGETAKPCY